MGTTLALRATAASYGSMYAWMFLFGMALALTFPNIPKALGVWFLPEELGLANGVMLAFNGVGAGLAAMLTPLIVEPLGGWRNLTYVLGFLTIGLGVAWFATVRDRSLSTTGATNQLAATAALRRVLRIRDVWILACCHILFLGGYIGSIGYLPTYFVEKQGMTQAASGLVVSLFAWAYVPGALALPALSDRVGLRKVFYFPGMVAAGLCLFLTAYALGTPLWIVAITLGLVAGVAPLAFVVPLEMEGVGPQLAGSAVGVALTAGYLGGVLAPIIGMGLVGINPVLGFAFWGGCYATSGCLFLLLKETGPRVRQAE
jgi:nitrate/nitrite transporter NarK